MRVLVVSGIFPPDAGGPASYVPALCYELFSRGHFLEVLCFSERTDQRDSEYPFRVERIRRGLPKPLREGVTIWRLWRLSVDKEVIFVNGLGFEATVSARLAGVPTVHKVVGDYSWERATNRGWFKDSLDDYQAPKRDLRLRFLDWLRDWPLRSAAGIIVPSVYRKQNVIGWGHPAFKINVIYNAVAPVTSCDAP